MSLSNDQAPNEREPNEPTPQKQAPDDQVKLSNVLATFWENISSKVDAYAITSIQTRIEAWVGKEPELTEVLCEYAVQHAPLMREGEAEAAIDQIVRTEIVKDWENSLAAPHLSGIQNALLRNEWKDSLLILYIQILQRGEIAQDNSPEQAALLKSGLVKVEGGKLNVANDLYSEVFDLNWVEQQVPGITKPVTIVTPQTAKNAPSDSTKLYSKLAIAACGLAVVGAAISSYIRESGGEAQAIPDTLSTESALVEAVPEPLVDESQPDEALSEKAPAEETDPNNALSATKPSETSAKASDRERFDTGEEHAKNSRWVLMMREFCEISPESVYFTSAQKDLARWSSLYSEDLKIAVDVVSAEQGGQCAIAATPLSE